jgi:hypothetical protein
VPDRLRAAEPSYNELFKKVAAETVFFCTPVK